MHTHDSTRKNNVVLTDLGYSGVSGFPDTHLSFLKLCHYIRCKSIYYVELTCIAPIYCML